MMTAKEIRKEFLEYFKSKEHVIVPSAPIVIKNDPTLMFTNAGMNQFKDIFLGNKTATSKRIADTQKCLRVSGKHNDIEEVGIDTYHHTMFEMLGNWSFGDYFKKEAIEWAWELLTKIYKIDTDRLYVTIFEGDAKENLERDNEAYDFWKQWIAEDRILLGNKKDNFWEMGDTGPCGPCSEIHVDMRGNFERERIDGKKLVNAGDPQVIEIWNLVFIQFNRQSNGSLQSLPSKHVDTGMGFERLTRVLQLKSSNYDTDIFQPFIQLIEKKSGIKYGTNEKTDIAMRVMSDHIRAIGFTIADGQIPSNTGAGYVIRRILRRAVRYYYSFLNLQSPVLYELVKILAQEFGEMFPEIKLQKDFVARVIEEEEISFLKTLESGLKRIAQIEERGSLINNTLDGKTVFELYDTYGFPIDLTGLIATDKGWKVDEKGFIAEMEKQKDRSRKASEIISSDWVEISKPAKIEFVGYDFLESKSQVVKYRKQKTKDKEVFQLVLDNTPFYAESGGQVGDKGKLFFGNEEVEVLDTKKENDLIIHFVNRFPENINSEVRSEVNPSSRKDTMNNHTATHLLHAALRNTLGTHVQQKGSLVSPDYLRFDFSHFSKVTKEELEKIEMIVNEKIRENIQRDIQILPIEEAMKTGAMALFGEKYGDKVRVVTFDKNFSRELCGGTHVVSTAALGFFKIVSESAVAAGVRRIEAITGSAAGEYINSAFNQIEQLHSVLGKDLEKGVQHLQDENFKLKKIADKYNELQIQLMKKDLLLKTEAINGINFISAQCDLDSAEAIKKLAYELRNDIQNLVFAGGASIDGKAQLCLIASDNLVQEKNIDASRIIKLMGKEINGGGGGQKFFATAGGTNPDGIENALQAAKKIISEL